MSTTALDGGYSSYTTTFHRTVPRERSPKQATSSQGYPSPHAIYPHTREEVPTIADIKSFLTNSQIREYSERPFHGVSLEVFRNFVDLLNEVDINWHFTYDASAESLMVHYSALPVHEVFVTIFSTYFNRAIAIETAAAAASPSDPAWLSSTNQRVKSPKNNEFIPDFTISKGPTEPLLAMEVAFSQTLKSVKDKLRKFYQPIPGLVAVIIVNLRENPSYSQPPPQKEANIDQDIWQAVRKSLTAGQMIRVQDKTWLGVTKCDVLVWVPGGGPADGMVFNENLVPGPCDDFNDKLRAALDPYWKKVVRAGLESPNTTIAPLPEFETSLCLQQYRTAMHHTALDRFTDWMQASKGKRGQPPEDAESESQSSRRSGTRAKRGP